MAALSLYPQAGTVIGAPWLIRGRDPAGWDCWGCVRWGRREWLGQDSPSWAEAYPDEAGVHPGRLALRTAELIGQRIAAWNAVPASAGAVVLLEVFGRPAHVGLMLDRRNFLEARQGGTGVSRVDDERWEGRILGFYDHG